MMHTEGARDKLHTNPKKQNKKTSLYHTLFNTSFFKNYKKKKKEDDASDTWVASLSQKENAVKTSDIHDDKIFEYSFIASISGIIISVKRIEFSFSSGTGGEFLRSSLMVT